LRCTGTSLRRSTGYVSKAFGSCVGAERQKIWSQIYLKNIAPAECQSAAFSRWKPDFCSEGKCSRQNTSPKRNRGQTRTRRMPFKKKFHIKKKTFVQKHISKTTDFLEYSIIKLPNSNIFCHIYCLSGLFGTPKALLSALNSITPSLALLSS
jgi:hypothetical protein